MSIMEQFKNMDEVRAYAEKYRPHLSDEDYAIMLFVLGLLDNEGIAVPVTIDGNEVLIDRYLAPYIEALNRNGYATLACCSGLEEEHEQARFNSRRPYISFAFSEPLFQALKEAEAKLKVTVEEGTAYLKRSVSVKFQCDTDYEIKARWAALMDFLMPG